MIDNQTVGKCIARLRSAQGMTQQGLASALNVSHQAVSKWEKGAALPDMQTFFTMSRLFGVTMEQILMGEAEVREAEAQPSLRQRIMNMIGRDGGEAAAIRKESNSDVLKLEDVEMPEAAQKIESDQPHPEDNEKSDGIQGGECVDIGRIIKLAPFMGRSTLDQMIRSICQREEIDWNDIRLLAPFLGRETLDYLVEMCGDKKADKSAIIFLAPFLERQQLMKLIKNSEGETDWDMVQRLAPFLGSEMVDALAMKLAIGDAHEEKKTRKTSHAEGKIKKDEVFRQIMYKALQERNSVWVSDHIDMLCEMIISGTPEEKNRILDGILQDLDLLDQIDIEEMAEHLEKNELEMLASRLIDMGKANLIEEFFEYLDKELREKIALRMKDAGNWDCLEEVYEHLDEQALGALAQAAIEAERWDQLEEIYELLDEEVRAKIALSLADAGYWNRMEDIYDLLDDDTLSMLAQKAMEAGRWDALEEISEYLEP